MFVCCTPTYPPPKTFFGTSGKYIYVFFFFFFALFSSENQEFPIVQQCKRKNMQKKKKYIFFFLPTQPKIQGRGTANKQFFKEGHTLKCIAGAGFRPRIFFKLDCHHMFKSLFCNLHELSYKIWKDKPVSKGGGAFLALNERSPFHSSYRKDRGKDRVLDLYTESCLSKNVEQTLAPKCLWMAYLLNSKFCSRNLASRPRAPIFIWKK